MPTDTNEPPRQDILLKLLKMTTSSNDGEALTAIRKANAVLIAGGWDWDKLISRKIVIVEDPFSKVQAPPSFNNDRHVSRPQPFHTPPPQPPPMRPTAPPPPPPPPPKPRPAPPPLGPYSNKANIYAGWCFCCGDTVPGQAGFMIKPFDHNPKAPDKWVPICTDCNKKRASIMRSAAPRQKPLTAAPDLSKL